MNGIDECMKVKNRSNIFVMGVPNYCNKEYKIIALITMAHRPEWMAAMICAVAWITFVATYRLKYWDTLKLLVILMVKHKTCLKIQIFIKRFAKVHGPFEWTWTELWLCNDIMKNLWCTMKHRQTPHLQRQFSARQHLIPPAC